MRNNEPRTCHCGHMRGDQAIQEEPEYSLWGWIVLSMFGMTPRPLYISFRCMYCRDEVGRSRDSRLLARRSTPTTTTTTAATTRSTATATPTPPS